MEQVGLVTLLRAAWLLATLLIVAVWLPLPGFRWLRRAILELTKRGKISKSDSNLTVPHSFFSHFYVVGTLWTTMLLVAVWSYAMMIDQQDHLNKSLPVYDVWLSVFMLSLMEAQVVRRVYDSVNVFNYSPSARLHISGYLLGVFYYIATPLTLCCSITPEVFEFVKNLDITELNMLRTKFDIWLLLTPLLRLRWYAWIGALIFLWGWVHQFRCHVILGSLRNKPENLNEYAIPHGDWFEYVSSAHYTAEIVIYGGLLVASGGRDLSLWLLFAFVVANLGFVATLTHAWYLQKFDDYPRKRRAIFPFVY
ncbi:putative polyprenol reductase [Helianthus annuus]|nr:putative polyprenol reductase [Helianthus annuus]KAJ0432575.1 putative polyprenol reductase [Helianthus annuus]KAJ0446816.1 putative polyprenol reductase [Helianthus annuus]KAJ0631710.1 putative polyprenol reductase [Helianthus annuus]KAJ0825464.1 putative polyprenol reductase [Helianthus annuus]